MDAQFHEEFVKLVAVFYSGDLSEEEWALLQVHLAYCDACRQVFEQYAQITSEVIPMMAATAAASSSLGIPEPSDASFAAAQERLLQQADSRAADQPKVPTAVPWSRLFIGALAACLVCCLIYASMHFLNGPKAKPPMASPSGPSTQPILKPARSIPEGELNTLREQDGLKIAALQKKLEATEAKSAQTATAVLELQRQLDSEQMQQQQLVSQREALNQKLTVAQAASESLQNKLAAEQNNSSQQTAQVNLLQAKVRQLNAAVEDANTALNNKDRMLALDKDFLAHDRDIRDLIGARNLYIADIFDTNTNGTAAKPFGRIFYTQDRSLVFYGFDLDKQAGITQSAAFQVWGSGSDQRPVSLGLFYQDDTHKRWVLRSNDAATLSHMNMVFVTVEPPGGSSKPTGKQLLRAYLQIQPNHP
jgi:hypothetical protein